MSVQTTKEDEGTAENPTLVPSTEHARLIGCLCMYTGLKLLVFNLTLDQEFFSNIVIPPHTHTHSLSGLEYVSGKHNTCGG
jgi:hypothetical protein